jgi:hypothetical protein
MEDPEVLVAAMKNIDADVSCVDARINWTP